MGKHKQLTTYAQAKAAMPKPNGRDRVYSFGDLLYLRASLGRAGEINRTWVCKYSTKMLSEKGRPAEVHYHLDASAVELVTLAEARQAVRKIDLQRREAWKDWKPGDPVPANDPMECRRRVRKARKTKVVNADAIRAESYDQATDRWVDLFSQGWKNPMTRQICISQQRTYVSPYFGAKSIKEVTVDDAMACLTAIWMRMPETASTVQNRMERIFNFVGRHHGDNPAWAAKRRLPVRQRRSGEHHMAMPYSEIPILMDDLRATDHRASAGMQFLVLTAVRRGEVFGNTDGKKPPMTWAEVDMAAKVWTIPGCRMKEGKQHRVPLSPAAMALLHEAEKLRCDERVFPVHPHTPGWLFKRLRPGMDYTIHGFRGSFRSWAFDNFDAAGELAEAALAHAAGEVVEAYRRTDALERRRRLMELWANYCTGGLLPDNVVEIIPKRDAA